MFKSLLFLPYDIWQHLPHRPQSAHDTISSHLPVFLFSISSPRQKSQYLLVLTVLLDAADDAAVIDSATAAARLLTAVIQHKHCKSTQTTFRNHRQACRLCNMCIVRCVGHNNGSNDGGTRRTNHKHNTTTQTCTHTSRHGHRQRCSDHRLQQLSKALAMVLAVRARHQVEEVCCVND